MKFKAYRHLGSRTFRGLIPKRYHSQFTWSDFDGAETVLLMFAHDRKDVVLSSTVRQALDSIHDLSERLRVAVSGGFTVEAEALLTDTGFRICALSYFGWTDASYKSITKATA